MAKRQPWDCLYDDCHCSFGQFACCYWLCCRGAGQGMMLEKYKEPKPNDSFLTQLAKACCFSCLYHYNKHPPQKAYTAKVRPAPINKQPAAHLEGDRAKLLL